MRIYSASCLALAVSAAACGGSSSGGGAICDDAGICNTGGVAAGGGAPGGGGAGSGGAPGGGGTSLGGAPSGGGGAPSGGGAPGGGAPGGGGAPSGGGGTSACTPTSSDACDVCVNKACCKEWNACVASYACYDGGPSGEGEIFCFQSCYTAKLTAGSDPTTAKVQCAGSCVTPGTGTIADATNDLIACLDQNCLSQCFQ